ncbi:MAG: hypothetical protein ACQEW2_17770 [Bacillota bacterium]
MNKRNETSIIYTDDSMVFARSDQYYVGVVKNNRNSDQANSFVVIINEELKQGKQREVMSKRFTKQSLMIKFLITIVPEYFLEQRVLNETYNAIQKLIKETD